MAGKQELWQMAVSWLRALGVLPPSSPACSPNARVYDLALALQDGTVLCFALNVLHPNSVKMIHEKPEKQFLKLTNINTFLAACQTQFGLSQKDLFNADHLYYASDFARVVNTISLLSKTPIAGCAGFKYFPQDDGGAALAPGGGDEEGGDVYQALEDLVGQSLSLQEVGDDVYDEDEGDEQEDIYGSIQNVIEDNGEEVYTDLLYSEGESIYGVGGLATPDEKRNNVASELLDTERNYVKVLNTIVGVFQKSFANNPKIISKTDTLMIFSNVTELLAAHKTFLKHLEAQMASTSGRMVSEPFLTCSESFRCYSRFCCDIPDAINKLKELSAKPAAAKIMQTAKSESGQRFPLKDLLNVPMQRILKYPLLLKELVKYTPEMHPDRQKLPTALQRIQDIAKYINDTKKDYDNLKNISASLKGYSGPPIVNYGRLIKDGDLQYKIEGGREKLKPRYVFMFERALLFCKAAKVHYNHKQTVDMNDTMEVIDFPHWQLAKDEQNGKYTFAWCIKGQKQTHVFAAKSLPIKKKWMHLMTDVVTTIKDAKSGPPPVAARGGGGGGPAAAAVSSAPTDVPAVRASTGSRGNSGKKPAAAPAPAAAAAAAAGGAGAASDDRSKQSYEQWVVGAPPKSGLASGGGSGADIGKTMSDDRWYAGKKKRPHAEKLLADTRNGTFLVRESDSRPGDFSLSIKYDIVKHIKINRNGNLYELAPDAKAFPTIHELVDHFSEHSLNRHFPGMETCLAIPFKDAVGGGTMARGGMSSTQKPVLGIGRARSRFAYQAKSHDELSFERGVEICILSTHDQDPGWWKGALPDGRVGIFPANYVQQL